MSFKYTVNTLKKMEQLMEESGYTIRYERGNFNSGFCLLEEKKVIVINKFLSVEGRINALADLCLQLQMNEEILSGEMQKWLRELRAHHDFRGKSSSLQTKMDI